jgi:hypothetical protein
LADISYIGRTAETKIVGQDSVGNSVNYVSADANGNLFTKDYSDGPVSPGTAAASSLLIGGQYNSTPPTLTNTQQVALQVDAAGRLLVDSAVTFPYDTNYGTVGANTLRTASQIGNATGAAAFGAGTTGAQVLRVVLPTDQTGINTFLDKNITGTIAALNGNVAIATNGMASVIITVTGTWAATLTFEGFDGTNWVVTAGLTEPAGGITESIIANGTTLVNCGGYSQIRIIATAYTSGTANIFMNAGAGPSLIEVYNDSQNPLITKSSSSDFTGTGTITALNGFVTATTTGCGSVVFNVTGTWVATLTIQATVDGVTWETTNGNIVALDDSVQFFASNAFLVVPCGGFSEVRLIATAFTSGTVAIAWNAGAGSNVTPVFNNVAAAFNAQVVGNVASGSVDSGNGIKIASVANANIASLPTVADGNRVDAQSDLQGRIYVTNAPTDGAKPTYSASVTVAPAATATDVVTLAGSATTTIRITLVRISGISTTAITTPVLLIKRSAANTGGTSAALTRVPHDSNSAAATAAGLSYTVNPTALGAAVGTVRQDRLSFAVTGSTAQDPIVWDFGDRPAQAIVLRGTTQILAINLNGVTITGGSISVDIEWTEE